MLRCYAIVLSKQLQIFKIGDIQLVGLVGHGLVGWVLLVHGLVGWVPLMHGLVGWVLLDLGQIVRKVLSAPI